MLKKIIIPLGLYPHHITTKKENTSQDMIKLSPDFFTKINNTVKTMRVTNDGLVEVFKNGFTAKK